MKSLMLLLLVCFTVPAVAQYNLQNLSLPKKKKIDEHQNSSPSYQHLQLYPVIANQTFLAAHKDIPTFTNLQNAIQSEKVMITEVADTQAPGTLPTMNFLNEEDENDANLPIHTRINGSITNARSPEDVQENLAQNSSNSNQNMPSNVEVPPSPPPSSSPAIADTVTPHLSIFDDANLPPEVVQNYLLNNGGTVNALQIQNVSNDTVYLMAGEVIQGGKQDRVIAKDMVIAPNSELITLPVFCVEKGRWSYEKGVYKNFNQYFQVANIQVRKSLQGNTSQEKVWQTIEKFNNRNLIASQTDAYTDLAQSEGFMKQITAYNEHLADAFTDTPNVIGVIAVSGDQVIGCDMFATPQLFAQQYPNLLYAYATEAISNGDQPQIEPKAVQQYLATFLAAEDGEEKLVKDKGSVFELDGKKVHISGF